MTLSNTRKSGSRVACVALIWAAMLLIPGLDAAQTWATLTAPSGNPNLFDIDFINENFGAVARTSGADVSYTTNDGLTSSNSPDNAPPTITCAGPVTINTTAGLYTGTTTLAAPTAIDNCPGGNGLSFDGSNDWVSTPVTLGSNPTATIEAWLYPISTTDNMRIISNTSGGTTGLTTRFQGGKLQFWSACGTWQDLSNTVIPANQWTHIAVVINGNQVTGFINGVQGLTITCSTLIQNLGMGGNYFGNGTYFHGKMDEVRFWNVARTQAQIAANMNTQINAQAGLIGLYHLNEGLAGGNNTGITTATDNSGSSNHGTLNNFALSGPTSNWTSGYLTYTDNEPPTITCAGPVTINTTAGLCTGTTTLTYPTVTDNCNVVFLKNAINSDGVNDYMTAPFSGAGLNQVSVEFRFKKGNTTNSGIFEWSGSILSTNPWILLRDLGSNVSLYVNGDYRITSAALNVNTWYHVAITYDGSTWRMYIDGNLSGSYNGSIGAYARTNVSFGSGYPTYWKGTIDEARIWSTARTQTQIQNNMTSELIGNESNLVAYWRFNQGNAGGDNSGLTTATATVGPNGTLNNFALNGSISNWIEVGLGDISNNAPATYPKGNTTVTWTATDASGNTNTCQQTVTVVDNQAPTLTNPGNQAMNVIGNTCAANYTIADPVSDNCTGSTWGYTLTGATAATVTGIPDGTSSGVLSFNQGITTVVLSATDGTNSAATVSFTVTVQDNTDTDGDGTSNCNDGCPNDPNKIAPGICGCGVADTDTDGDGTANCNDGCPNDPNKTAPGICGCGNSDTGPLTVTCPASVPVISTNSSCQGTIQDYTALAMVSGTGCATVTVGQTPPQGTIVNPGTVVIKLTVTDSNSGETATCMYNVTVSGGCGN